MSTFSSVVRKPGQKITPKAAPRRAATRHNIRSDTQSSAALDVQSHSYHADLISEAHSQPETEIAAEPELTSATPDNEATRKRDAHSRGRHSSTLPLTEATNVLDTGQARNLSRPSDVHSNSTDRRRSQRHVSCEESTNGTGLSHVTSAAAQAASKRRTDGSRIEPTSSDAVSYIPNGGPIDCPPDHGKVSKKRKVTRITSPAVAISQTTMRNTRLSRESAPIELRGGSSGIDRNLRPADELLQNATAQAAAVSTLANSIDSGIRLLRPRHSQSAIDDLGALSNEVGRGISLSRRSLTRGQIPTGAGVSDSSAAPSQRMSKKRNRKGTPENAEEHEINATEVRIGDLTKDNRLGKPSELGQRLRENWPEVQRRRKDQLALNRTQANERGKHGRKIDRQTGVPETQIEPIIAEVPVPQMAIVNGVITVTTESREVAFGAGLEKAMVQDAETALEDDKIYRYVNQGTFGKNAGASRGFKWDEDQTKLFYQGLRMFGTDFMMIANLFPGMTRKQIKLKYVKEERLNLARVRENLANRQDVALDEYAKLTNKEFEDPKKVQEELEAEEKRLRAEDGKRRAQEGFVTAGDETLVQSMENGNKEPVVPAEDIENDLLEPNTRSQADASSTLKDTALSKKRQRKPRDGAKIRQSKKGRRPLEGVEERIGPIDEVGR